MQLQSMKILLSLSIENKKKLLMKPPWLVLCRRSCSSQVLHDPNYPTSRQNGSATTATTTTTAITQTAARELFNNLLYPYYKSTSKNNSNCSSHDTKFVHDDDDVDKIEHHDPNRNGLSDTTMAAAQPRNSTKTHKEFKAMPLQRRPILDNDNTIMNTTSASLLSPHNTTTTATTGGRFQWRDTATASEVLLCDLFEELMQKYQADVSTTTTAEQHSVVAITTKEDQDDDNAAALARVQAVFDQFLARHYNIRSHNSKANDSKETLPSRSSSILPCNNNNDDDAVVAASIVILYNFLVEAWVKVGEYDKAEQILRQMNDITGIKPDRITYETVLRGWSNVAYTSGQVQSQQQSSVVAAVHRMQSLYDEMNRKYRAARYGSGSTNVADLSLQPNARILEWMLSSWLSLYKDYQQYNENHEEAAAAASHASAIFDTVLQRCMMMQQQDNNDRVVLDDNDNHNRNQYFIDGPVEAQCTVSVRIAAPAGRDPIATVVALLDSGSCGSMVSQRLLCPLKATMIEHEHTWSTMVESLHTHHVVWLDLIFPDFNNRRFAANFHVQPQRRQSATGASQDDEEEHPFPIVLGHDALTSMGMVLDFYQHKFKWDDLDHDMPLLLRHTNDANVNAGNVVKSQPFDAGKNPQQQQQQHGFIFNRDQERRELLALMDKFVAMVSSHSSHTLKVK